MTLTASRAEPTPSEHLMPTPTTSLRFTRAALSTDPVTVAQRLLGALLVRDLGAERSIARIVETEAYGGADDRASHARAGRTPRTTVMFGPPGHAYIYLVYGMHHCLNVVCGDDGAAAAVLVRAVEPVAGLERMRSRRGAAAGSDVRLAAGPGRTCQALGIDRALDGIDLVSDDRLWLARDPASAPEDHDIVCGPRVGVDYAGPEWATRPWRFGVAGSAALSKPFSGPR